jgi:hypothetical protein
MDKKCKSQFDGHKCQLPRNHSGEHLNHGKRSNLPCFVRWSDEGARAVEKELQKVSVESPSFATH